MEYCHNHLDVGSEERYQVLKKKSTFCYRAPGNLLDSKIITECFVRLFEAMSLYGITDSRVTLYLMLFPLREGTNHDG